MAKHGLRRNLFLADVIDLASLITSLAGDTSLDGKSSSSSGDVTSHATLLTGDTPSDISESMLSRGVDEVSHDTSSLMCSLSSSGGRLLACVMSVIPEAAPLTGDEHWECGTSLTLLGRSVNDHYSMRYKITKVSDMFILSTWCIKYQMSAK